MSSDNGQYSDYPQTPRDQGLGGAPQRPQYGTGMAHAYAPSPVAGYSGLAPQYVSYPHQAQQSSSFFNLGNDRFIKGLVIGAAATYLLTNESVQRATIRGAVKAWTLLQGSVEELKERFQDAEAELRAAESSHKPGE